MSILLRRCTTQFLVLDRGLEEEEPEPGVVDEMEDLGVWTGILFFPGVLGVVVFDLFDDCGVLGLPALPGVLWAFVRVVMKSLPIPLCLDVLLQVWQVAITTEEDL